MTQTISHPLSFSLSHSCPFGSIMPTRVWSDASREYRYGFNGKEGENFLDHMYDFEHRMYNHQIGRFIAKDPSFKKFPWNSLYSFCENKVIRFIELEGLESAECILWNDLGINQNTANQCVETVNKCISDINDVTNKYIVPGVTIVGGAILIAATAGAASPAVLATVTGVLSGTMAVVGGSIKLALNMAGECDIANNVPTTYLGATVSVVIKVVNGDNVVTKVVTGIIDIVEGVATLSIPESSDLEAAGNVLTVTSIVYTGTQSLNYDNSAASGTQSNVSETGFNSKSSSVSSGAINSQNSRQKNLNEDNNQNTSTASTQNNSSTQNNGVVMRMNSSTSNKCDQDVLQTPPPPVK